MLVDLPISDVAASQDWIRDAFIRRFDYVVFHQEIDRENVDRVLAILRPHDILDLQSPGGDFDQSIRLATAVRDNRVRVRTTAHCTSGCAIVWVTAPERIVDGFAAVTFHGTPLTSLAWMRANPATVTADEMRLAETSAAKMSALLDEAGVQPWLFHCAFRLQNLRHEASTDLTLPPDRRIRTTGDYQIVWFPRSILEAAGVRQLSGYDAPNARQRTAIESPDGDRVAPRRIYWARDGDCDPEIRASADSKDPQSPSNSAVDR